MTTNDNNDDQRCQTMQTKVRITSTILKNLQQLVQLLRIHTAVKVKRVNTSNANNDDPWYMQLVPPICS